MKEPIHLLTHKEISDSGRRVEYFARCGHHSAEKKNFSQNIGRTKENGERVIVVTCSACLRASGMSYVADLLESMRASDSLS